MKNILLIVPSLIQGGFERICLQTAGYLKDKANVRIVLFDITKTFYDTGDIEIVDLNKPGRESKLGKVINVFARTWALYRTKKKYKADIALSFGPSATIPNMLLNPKRCQTWVSFRSYLDLDNSMMTGPLTRKADRVICCSRGIENELIKRFNFTNTETIYNPYEIANIVDKAEEFTPDIPFDNDDFCVVTMGRDDEIKGFWHLIKAFRIFKEKKPDARLMFIGIGDFAKSRQLVSELGLDGDVFFAGGQKNPYPYLKRADMYVLSSINEGFPNALIEAMALGIPVVSTDCLTGPAEILMEDGLSMDTKDVYEAEYGILVPRVSLNNNYDSKSFEDEDYRLAEGMVKLISDSEAYLSYKDKAVKRARDFSVERYVGKLIGDYE